MAYRVKCVNPFGCMCVYSSVRPSEGARFSITANGDGPTSLFMTTCRENTDEATMEEFPYVLSCGVLSLETPETDLEDL